ncbi:MAG: HAMP domain-containing protein, partial [Candidatus Asgardarchaeia archaeon]
GDLSRRAELKSKDEIGVLADAFNSMAKNLEESYAGLEKKVEERTVKLKEEVDERKQAEDEVLKSREELRNLASHLQTVREEERTSIARELHDEISQNLAILKKQTLLTKW